MAIIGPASRRRQPAGASHFVCSMLLLPRSKLQRIEQKIRTVGLTPDARPDRRAPLAFFESLFAAG
jgi:hypothetical protein